jgi:hypothetical protein
MFYDHTSTVRLKKGARSKGAVHVKDIVVGKRLSRKLSPGYFSQRRKVKCRLLVRVFTITEGKDFFRCNRDTI